MSINKMKKASMDSITRKIMADTFVKSVAKKVKDSDEFTPDEKEATKWAVGQIKSAAESWTTSGRGRSKGAGSRDALYLREYRARIAVENAEKAGASQAILKKLRADHREALDEYEKWKAENGLKPRLKVRPARTES